MWGTKPPPPPATEPKPDTQLHERVAKLEENLRLQEKGLKALELDWQEWFDKFRLLYIRLAKRIADWQRLNPDPDPPQSPQDAPRSTNPRAVSYDRPLGPTGQHTRSGRNY